MEVEKSTYNPCQEGQSPETWVLPDSCPSGSYTAPPLKMCRFKSWSCLSHMDLEKFTCLPVSLFVKLGNNSFFEGQGWRLRAPGTQ